jgi:hypothetical protein
MLSLSTNPTSIRGSPIRLALVQGALTEYLKGFPVGRRSITYERKYLPAQLAELWDLLQDHPAGLHEDLKIRQNGEDVRIEYSTDDFKFTVNYGVESVVVLKR